TGDSDTVHASQQPFPRCFERAAREGRPQRFKVIAERFRVTSTRWIPSLPRTHVTVASAQKQTVIRCPSGVVIRPVGVPRHHVAQSKFAPLALVERRRREHVSVKQVKSAGPRTELWSRIAGCNPDSSG